MRPLLGHLRLEPEDVAEVELVRVRLPLLRRHRAAHGTEAEREVVLVRIALADGVEGWGECSALLRPTYTAEHTAGAWVVLQQELVPALFGQAGGQVVGHPMAKAAVEGALTDALLRRAGRSLAGAFADGLLPAPAVATTVVISRADAIGEVVAQVSDAVVAGAALVKCKVTPARLDLDAVCAVRSTWPSLPLAVDWNQTGDVDSLAQLADLGLAYVEQPGPATDLLFCAELASRAGAAVALDESIGGPGDLRAAAALGAGTVLNLKPARLGGLASAAATLEAATEAGWTTFVGGMLETGVGRAAALAVAAHPAMAHPTDLGPSNRYFEGDLTDPVVVDGDGRVIVPGGPGIGRTVNAEAVAAFAVERARFDVATVLRGAPARATFWS